MQFGKLLIWSLSILAAGEHPNDAIFPLIELVVTVHFRSRWVPTLPTGYISLVELAGTKTLDASFTHQYFRVDLELFYPPTPG